MRLLGVESTVIRWSRRDENEREREKEMCRKIRKVREKMKKRKAAGNDEIPNEMLKYLEEEGWFCIKILRNENDIKRKEEIIVPSIRMKKRKSMEDYKTGYFDVDLVQILCDDIGKNTY